jgi:hypothetical protein
MACEHETFRADCRIGRLTEGEGGPVTSWVLEAEVRCADCGERFGFLGPSAGIRNNEPTTSQDGLELRCPIVPGPVPRTGPAFYEFPERLTGKQRHA